jgi:hypothetical protein
MVSLPVLSSCGRVVESSRFVRVNRHDVCLFLQENPRLKIPPIPIGPASYHFFDGTGITAQWIFVLDILNHCFWPDEGCPRWEIEYGEETLSGYWALAESLRRAMEEGIPIHQAQTLANLDRAVLAHVLRGRGELQLFEKRLENLQQAGQVLLDRFQGSFLHVLEEAGGSGVQLVLLLAREFASFDDSTSYNGERVYFYKRGQLLAMDLWCTFAGKSWGGFTDLDKLTAFADYKLPQVLRQMNILSYQSELANRVDRLVPLPAGSPEEVEIRAATIWAVEVLSQELARRGQSVTAAQLDNWLWTLGQQDTFRSRPYHRTRTIFY